MINGKVEGDIHATERLELAERAVVDGDVYYNLIEMAVGAKVNGGLRHTSNVADDSAAKRGESGGNRPRPHFQLNQRLNRNAAGKMRFRGVCVSVQ